jgi:hypothetical protein
MFDIYKIESIIYIALYCPGICVEVLRKSMKYLSHNIRVLTYILTEHLHRHFILNMEETGRGATAQRARSNLRTRQTHPIRNSLK